MADVEAAATTSDDGGAPAPAPRPPLKRSPRAAAFVNITEGDNQRSNKEKDPSFLFNLAVTRRRPVCGCLFLTNLSFIILTVALGLAGLNPINTNNIGEVGLILPDETYQRRENGYHTAKNEADYAIAGGKCPRQDVADPITFRMMRDEFESESKGNAFTQSGLNELRSRENQVLTKNGWSARCNTVYKTPYLDGCEVAADVQIPVAVYLFEKYGDPDFEDIPGTVKLIQTTSETDYQSLLDMLHKDFTPSNMRSKYLTSTIYAGTPRHAVSRYVNNATLQLIEAGQRISYYSDKYKERERDHLSGWIKRELQDRFERNFRNRNYPTAFVAVCVEINH